MRKIASISILSIILGLTAFVYASGTSRGWASITQEGSRPTILCLNHKVNTGAVDVSMVPAYDWVHAGQQGINFTVTNKTNEKMVIYWDKGSLRAAGEVSPDRDLPGEGPNGEKFYDTVAPGATFSKTLWPRSNGPKFGKLENRGIYLTAATETGSQHHDEIILDVAGQNRICGR